MGLSVTRPFTIKCKQPQQHDLLSRLAMRMLAKSGPCHTHISPWWGRLTVPSSREWGSPAAQKPDHRRRKVLAMASSFILSSHLPLCLQPNLVFL